MGPLQQDELPTLLETDDQILAKLVEGMLPGPADHTGGPQMLPPIPCPTPSCLSRVEGQMHGKTRCTTHNRADICPCFGKGLVLEPEGPNCGAVHQVSRPPCRGQTQFGEL